MAAVALDNVGKIYPNGHRGLIDINLRVDDGELIVIVGPSGCGKSTLLRTLAGLERPSSGHIRIGDHTVNTWSPQQRNVAMVFQDYALYPTMSVRENLEFPLKMRKLAQAEIASRLEKVVQMLNLGDVLPRLPKELSGGQRQRVAMGRALVREPTVFLLDEPLSNLDAKLRIQVRAEIADLQKRIGTTMIYVTHDQVEAMTLGRRIAILNLGRLQQVADPETLYLCPSNAFVAGFIGNPPMSLIASQLTGEENGCGKVHWGNHEITIPPSLMAANRFPISPGEKTEVIWGIRPEGISIVEYDGLSAVVTSLEYLGHETLVYLRSPNDEKTPGLIARSPGRPSVTPGATVKLQIAPDQLSLFVDAVSAVSSPAF